MAFSGNDTYKKKQLPWRLIEDEAVLVDVSKGEVIHINQTGASIWRLLDGRRTVDNIVSSLKDEYAVDAQAASADVFEFIEALLEKGVIECHS